MKSAVKPDIKDLVKNRILVLDGDAYFPLQNDGR